MELQLDKISLSFHEKVSQEMSAKEQLDFLDIDLNEIKEPILDIGCGEHGNLVNYFTNNRLLAFGIDKHHEETRNILNADWFDINFGIEDWGTIICNLTFCRHFLNNYHKNDYREMEYARAYIKILESLYVGGVWYYTPAVPFFEEVLDKTIYQVEYRVIHGDTKRTKITRLK